MTNNQRCGFVAIIGRPNVGKSTLLNAILKKKLVITSKKAQTTRHSILGIKTEKNTQAIYVDTPGFRHVDESTMHRYLNQKASAVIHDVDVLVMVVDVTRWTEDDDAVLSLLRYAKSPVLLLANKIDCLKNKNELLPIMQSLHDKYQFSEIIPVSALKDKSLSSVEEVIANYLPESEFMYDKDQLTDRDEKFLVSELIREKLMRFLGKEVPYSTAVEVEFLEESDRFAKISATIWVERKGQKPIVIGKDGETLKKVGKEARIDIEKILSKKIYLDLWVKVKEDWSSNDRLMKQFGYE